MRDMKPILHLCQKVYNSVFIPKWCLSASKLLQSTQGRWVEGSAVVTETGICAESGEVPAGTHSRIYTHGPVVQHTEYDFVTSPGQGLDNKGSGSQSGLLPHMHRCDKATGLNKFCQHGTTASKITLSPLQYWLKENYKTPANLLKRLKPDPEASQDLHWCSTFKPQPKSIYRPVTEEVVTADASKECDGGHMNKLSLWCR